MKLEISPKSELIVAKDWADAWYWSWGSVMPGRGKDEVQRQSLLGQTVAILVVRTRLVRCRNHSVATDASEGGDEAG